MTESIIPRIEKHHAHGLTKKEYMKEYNKQYQLDNKEKLAACAKEYRLANTEKIAEQKKRHRLKNKEKIAAQQKDYFRTREGLVCRIYSNQRGHSKLRCHSMPNYGLEELRAWVFSQSNFEELYQNYANSDFDKSLAPSCDRLDDYKPYVLDNLRLVTWAENEARYHEDKKAGINTKNCKAVLQLTKEGVLISEHHSACQASRVTGATSGKVLRCCNGKQKSTSGYIWRFA